jgi:hypothetical protein
MKLLNPELLQQMVDYSFGDQSGVLGGVPNAYMKKANVNNQEFFEFMSTRKDTKPITLFIDNIRLYKRPLEYSDWLHLKPISEQDKKWLSQFDDENLLDLCKRWMGFKFIIFTAFEDTPLDNNIWGRIPENVLAIYSVNSVVFGGKVYPFPHGIERKMYEGYDHHETLLDMMDSPIQPENLLFIAHRQDTGNRKDLVDLFKDKDWVTMTHLPYRQYLTGIKLHKFVLCPSGNGIESARNWETLYMRRVPVMIKHPYMQELYKDFPVLWVNDFAEVTEELLKDNDHLYEQAQKFDMELLDLDWWFNKCTK